MNLKCSVCKKKFDRINLWLLEKKTFSSKYICRSCKFKNGKQKSFRSNLRDFRQRVDYINEEETFEASKFRISDHEFDEIIREFEEAHWTDTSSFESQKHQRYIEDLFRKEFRDRRRFKDRKREQRRESRQAQETYEVSDMAVYYNLLEVTPDATDSQLKDARRKLILRWHPDRNPEQPKYAERMLISIQEAYEKILKSRKKNL